MNTPDQLMRCHEIFLALLYYWKVQYAQDFFGHEPVYEATLEDCVNWSNWWVR